MTEEISIDFYLNNKNTIQEKINRLEQNQLIEVFNIILENDPNTQYSKNKNGYFIDIKILPVNIIEKINSKCDEFLTNLDDEQEEDEE